MPPLSPFSKSCVAIAVSQLMLTSSLTEAATITVDTNADDNGAGCTLREAIVSANNDVDLGNGCAVGSEIGTDIITFDSSSLTSNTITLGGSKYDSPNLYIYDKNIKIDASTIDGGITLDADQQSNVLYVAGEATSLVLDNITLTNGSAYYGGAMYVYGGKYGTTVTLNNCTVTGNSSSGQGGAIYIGSFFNQAYQGGLSLALNNSLVSNNQSNGDGGAISVGSFYGNANVSLDSSVVTGNESGEFGGAISANLYGSKYGSKYGEGVSVVLLNSTVSDNVAENGGALVVQNNANLILVNSTVSGNSATEAVSAILAYGGESGSKYSPLFASESSSSIKYGPPKYGSRVEIISSTISANVLGGEAVYDNSSTFGNSAVSIQSGNLTITSSIIANTEGQGNCEFASYSSNTGSLFIDSASIIEFDQGGEYGGEFPFLPTVENETAEGILIFPGFNCGANRIDDPGLVDLADNNGALTHALSEDSVARDSSDLFCLPVDQAGQIRDVSDGFCDVGALEFNSNFVSGTTPYVIRLPDGRAVFFEL